MSPFEKHFKKEYAHTLFSIAQSDYVAATLLMKSMDIVRLEIIIFQFQQAIEKSLKAVLCAAGKPVPMTHELMGIMTLLQDNQPPHAGSLNELSLFATVRRYEDGAELLHKEDVQNAEKLAKAVLDWAKKEIGKLLRTT